MAIKKMNKTKSRFFENINQIEKPLATAQEKECGQRKSEM